MSIIHPFRMSPDIRNLFIALSIGLVHGLVYIFVIPPWQHYDEPTHFEYAWLIADRNTLPQAGDVDREMRAEVGRSMIENDFFRELGFLPDLAHPSNPAWIGPISQLSNPPLYYLIASIPLRFIQAWDASRQVIAVRFISLGFLLLTVLAAWGVAGEVVPDKSALRLYLPASLAMLPGFVDVMTAVNNDAAAIALLSLCLWGSIHLVIHGLRTVPFVLTALVTALCLLTKETAFAALPLLITALIFAALRDRLRWIAWALIAAGMIAVLIMIISLGDASAWFRSTGQSATTRAVNSQVVHGEHVFRIDSSAPVTPLWSAPLFQPLPVSEQASQVEGSFTLGAWIWADELAEVNAPILGNGTDTFSKRVAVGAQPTFYAYTVTFPASRETRLWVRLDPGIKNSNNPVYYDGLVLVNKALDVNTAPTFRDESGTAGMWGGVPFTNLLRNASAEQVGLRISPWLDDLGARYLPDQTRPSSILNYLLDWKGVSWHYRLTAERLLRTFWAAFGWGHVPLLGHKPYRALGIITAVGAAGFIYWLIRQIITNGKLRWDVIFVSGLLMLIVWGGTISRGVLYLGHNRLYLPVARYAYPSAITTWIILCIGWQALFSWLPRWRLTSAAAPYIQGVIWFGFFILLDLYAILSILTFYQART